MLLLLVRHGNTALTGTRLSGRLPGVHLSEEGIRQAKGVAGRLGGLPIKAVYSSPLERCLETAEPIASQHGLQVRPLDAVAEVDYGEWTGRSFKQLTRLKAWSELHAKPADFKFPGGESIREAQTRAVGATQELLKRHPNQAIVVVSHADLIRLTMAAYLGMGLDLYQRVIVGVASVSAVALGDRVPRVVRLSDTGSLEELAARIRPRPATPAATAKPARPAGQGS
ncbi:MAG TPA: MSMEG_4193 family putative phosphomutase [Actinomycetota bacterium]|nr:MSMEG_4193 family putative phosphomutase [Actinomycetota bacterium]